MLRFSNGSKLGECMRMLYTLYMYIVNCYMCYILIYLDQNSIYNFNNDYIQSTKHIILYILYSQSLLLRSGVGHALVGGGHGVGLYYSPLPPIELPEMPPQAHASPLQVPQLGLHHINIYGQPITDAQVAHARLYKQGHPRPLGRTQSAPLPLGHPMLTGVTGPAGVPGLNQVTGPQLYDQPDVNHDGIDLRRTMLGDVNQIRSSIFHPERQVYDQRNLLQKIRQTVLTRSGREPQLKEEETSEVLIFYFSFNLYVCTSNPISQQKKLK